MRLFTLACIAAVQALRLPPRLVAPRQKFKTSLLAEAEAAAPAEAPKEEGASVAASTVNLVKSIVGAGVLALPAGVAAFSDAGPALWPATALITALGAASAYSFSSNFEGPNPSASACVRGSSKTVEASAVPFVVGACWR